MHSIVTTFRGAVIKVEVANVCAAMDTLIDQDGYVVAIIITKMCHKSTGNVVTSILVYYKSFHINCYLRI